jgi:Cdc6-like AAA superfamily ATPase
MTHGPETIFEDVDQRTIDHLDSIHLCLRSPDQDTCEAILAERITAAFTPDTVSDEARHHLAGLISDCFGNLHTGLKLLYWAAEEASQRGNPCVQVRHVEAARQKCDRESFVSGLLGLELTVHQQAILAALVEANRNGVDALSTTEAYDEYGDIVRANDRSPLSKRRFREQFKDLHDPWVVSVEKRPRRDGPAQWVATLVCDPVNIESALRMYGALSQYQEKGERFTTPTSTASSSVVEDCWSASSPP